MSMSRFLSGLLNTISVRFIKDLILVFAIAFLVLAVLTYAWQGRTTEQSFVQQTQTRQQVIARAGAKSVEIFLKSLGDTMTLLASNNQIVEADEGGVEVLNQFYSAWNDTSVNGVVFIDANGIVKFSSGRSGRSLSGVNLADRDYFAWAKGANKGEIFLGEPVISRLGSDEGQYILTIATPVHSDGEFNGALAIGMLISDISSTYFEPLRITKDTQVYLLNREGVILKSPYQQLLGVNYLDYLEGVSYKGSYAVRNEFSFMLSVPTERKLDVILPEADNENELMRFLIATSPIVIGNNRWTLALASPMKKTFAFISPFYRHQTTMLMLVIGSVLGITLLGIVAHRIIERNSYLEGFTYGRDYGDREDKKKSKRKSV